MKDGAAKPAKAYGPRHGGLVGLLAEIKRRFVAEINGPGADKASQGYVSCRPPHDQVVSPNDTSQPSECVSDAGERCTKLHRAR